MKILVGLDFSTASQALLTVAEQQARSLGAKLYLIHVVAPDPDFVGYEVGPQSVRDAVAHEYRDQHRQLQEAADRLRQSDLDTTALLVQGATGQTLLEEAAKLGVDQLVIGSHGHGAVYDLLVGSVSHWILQHTFLPVLVVPIRR